MEQTVVEWIESELDFLDKCMSKDDIVCFFNEAKDMFEKQIVKAVDSNFSYDNTGFPTLGKQYYDNTYKK